MLSNFNQHLTDNFPFLKGKKILVACSGGLDSVVLSRLLKELQINISLAHCNFSLRRNESDEDEKFVLSLADKLSIPIFNKKFDTKSFSEKNGVSTQMAARELRYQWFDELCKEHSFDYLVTAHHLDDDLETFFINLSRGTGLRGLTGIPSISEQVVRPLINFPREEILLYAKEKDIPWREDSSNKKTDYLRNKIRLEVIPNLKEADANLLKGFQKTQDNLQESLLLVNDYMALIRNLVMYETDDGLVIDSNKLQDLPNTKALLFELLSPFGFTAWDDISNILDAQSGKQIFSKEYRLIKNRNSLLLVKKFKTESVECYYIKKEDNFLDVPILLKIENVEKISEYLPNTAYIDTDKLVFPLKLRKYVKGDYFFPFGMKGKKKLSKFFKDEKLSLVAKEKIWVLLSDKKIVWVVGIRSDNRFKIDNQTKEILKITYLQK